MTADSLEDLYRDALLSRGSENLQASATATELLKEMKRFFREPQYWFQTHAVELTWHGEPQGIFVEYLHVTGARKLVRGGAEGLALSQEEM